jgi:penicillin-binding protein 1A
MAIKKVVLADGTVDTDAGWGRSKRKRVLSDGVAYEVTRILQQNITSGTGTGANYGDPSAAGKTGTTDDSADAWFAGYTPRASTVVWVGYPNAQIAMTSVHGITVAGGTFPATIWNLFMSRALAGAPELSWRTPKNPVVWEPFTGQYQFFGEPVEPKEPKKDKKKKKKQDDEPSNEPAPTTTETPPTTTEGR